ncbi:MAG: hypothetical protein WCL06_12825 [Bacteroidota bacterium]
MKTGDCVKIKRGVKDPYFNNYDLSSWQGRIINLQYRIPDIIAIPQEIISVEIELDSVTLMNLPVKYIYDCIQMGCDFSVIIVDPYAFDQVQARDTRSRVKSVRHKLSQKYDFAFYLDDEETIDELIHLEMPWN